MNATSAARVAETLRAAGHAESRESRNIGIMMMTTGFLAVPAGRGVVVAAILGDDAEGHFDSPAHHAARARMTEGYRQALTAAGWAVRVQTSGEALFVTGRRGLKAGDLVRLPGGRTAVVESVSLDGLRFTDSFGGRHRADGAELVPLAA
jgi:hypothetical protein